MLTDLDRFYTLMELLDEPKCAFVPLPRLKMVGNRSSKVDHDAEHGPINGRTYCDGNHRSYFSFNRTWIDIAISESRLDDASETSGQATDIARW